MTQKIKVKFVDSTNCYWTTVWFFAFAVAVTLCMAAMVARGGEFQFNASPSNTYIVQTTGALAGPWSDVNMVYAVSGPTSLFYYPDPSKPQQFFRLKTIIPDPPQATNFWYNWTNLSVDPFLDYFGMGTNEIGYVHSDVPHEWYRDQWTTGWAYQNNCGPTCTEMACRWYDMNTTATAEDIRNTNPNNGGWWYTSWIATALDSYGIPWHYEDAPSPDYITNILARGAICILCLDYSYIPVINNRVRVGGMWSATLGDGHFIIAKGVRCTSNDVWIECYDPESFLITYDNATFADHVPVGRDRAYGYNELGAAVAGWWPHAIVIEQPGTPQAQVSWIEPPPQHAP